MSSLRIWLWRISDGSGRGLFSTSPTADDDRARINKFWELIDETAELFKGELGDIRVLESMSLRELAKRRDIRINRKIKEAKQEEEYQKKLQKKREREMAYSNKGSKR